VLASPWPAARSRDALAAHARHHGRRGRPRPRRPS
jgi:hypothetical protein